MEKSNRKDQKEKRDAMMKRKYWKVR